MHWNIDYLEDNLNKADPCTVYLSDDHRFKYWSQEKIDEGFKGFKPPTECVKMSFGDFAKRLKSGKKRVYLQSPLNVSMGAKIKADYGHFRQDLAMALKAEGDWGELTSNLLLIGPPGNVTPTHFDEQENLFCQIRGKKRVFLFPPDQFAALYPYKFHHPHDRQAQVDIRNLDLKRFPKAKELKGLTAELWPGDVLYIPIYWFHEIESVGEEPVISVNYWFKVLFKLC